VQRESSSFFVPWLLKTGAADTLQAAGAEDKPLLGSKLSADSGVELSPSGKLIHWDWHQYMNTVTEVTGTARAPARRPMLAQSASGKGKVAKRGKLRTLVHPGICICPTHAKAFLAHINRQQTSNPAASSAFRNSRCRMTSGKRNLKRRVSQPFGARKMRLSGTS
jgi:hypothetical protein